MNAATAAGQKVSDDMVRQMRAYRRLTLVNVIASGVFLAAALLNIAARFL